MPLNSAKKTRPVTPVPVAPQCLGSNWTEDITDVSSLASGSTITVYQGIGCAVVPETDQPNASCVRVIQSIPTVP